MKKTYEIKPSVLAGNRKTFARLLRRAKKLSSKLHIDIMDGAFVHTRSISARDLASTRLSATTEVHLMVKRPTAWVEAVKKSGARRVIIPCEIPSIERAHAQKMYSQQGIRVGLAAKMGTPLSKIPQVAWIHLMLGPIGGYGAPMFPTAPKRVRTLRRDRPRTRISTDVGLNPATIPSIIKAGANVVIVGSYLSRARNSRRAWGRLQTQRNA